MNVALRSSVNIISLCTGGAGLDLGIELAMPGARSVCLVEREAFSATHLVAAMQQGLLAQAPVWSDVTTFNGRPWRGLVDGVIGGIPCQPHSLAGKRLGEDDERDLWSDARRIIVQSGAWFVLIENVRGMVTSGGFERVWRDLRRLGFEVEPGLFTASEVGASHQRERLFVLAVADSDRRQPAWRPAECRKTGGWRPHSKSSGSSSGFSTELADADYAGLALGQQSEVERGYLRDEGSSATARCAGMGNPIGGRHDGRPNDALGRSIQRAIAEGPGQQPDGSVADADLLELRRQPPAGQQPLLQPDYGSGQAYLFPPSPSDLRSWASVLASAPELEPAFRRVADGLASRLDTARVDRLRMLGNGVVSLEGAYAFRTLAARLAARGSAGSARLVRMMESAQ